MEHATYLIVGAGLAGSTCAYLLKRAGYDTLLVERDNLADKAKLCAGLVTPRALRMLDKLFDTIPDALFKQEFTEMSCHAASIPVNVADIAMKSVQRFELDRYVLDEYRKLGGRVIDGMHIRDYDFAHKAVYGRFRGGGLFSCSYETLIAADGALSSTRRALTGSSPDAILALETEVEHTGAPLTMAYEEGFFGYCWYAPMGPRAKIGCCAYRGHPDLGDQLRKFAAEMNVCVETCKGAFIPTGSDVLLEKDGVFFLGDAASLICPASGEGIFYALYSAHKLSLALLNHASYPALMKQQVDRIAREYKMRDLFFNTSFITHGLKLADATPYGAQRAVKFALRHFASYD